MMATRGFRLFGAGGEGMGFLTTRRILWVRRSRAITLKTESCVDSASSPPLDLRPHPIQLGKEGVFDLFAGLLVRQQNRNLGEVPCIPACVSMPHVRKADVVLVNPRFRRGPRTRPGRSARSPPEAPLAARGPPHRPGARRAPKGLSPGEKTGLRQLRPSKGRRRQPAIWPPTPCCFSGSYACLPFGLLSASLPWGEVEPLLLRSFYCVFEIGIEIE